jgi:hypothetical protein
VPAGQLSASRGNRRDASGGGFQNPMTARGLFSMRPQLLPDSRAATPCSTAAAARRPPVAAARGPPSPAWSGPREPCAPGQDPVLHRSWARSGCRRRTAKWSVSARRHRADVDHPRHVRPCAGPLQTAPAPSPRRSSPSCPAAIAPREQPAGRHLRTADALGGPRDRGLRGCAWSTATTARGRERPPRSVAAPDQGVRGGVSRITHAIPAGQRPGVSSGAVGCHRSP